MIIELFICACSLGLAVSGSFTFWPVQHGYDFYRPLVLLIGGYLLGLLLAWILLWLFGLPVHMKKAYDKPSKWCRFWLIQSISYINHHAGIKCKVIGKQLLPKNTRFLIVSNHRSNFDSMLITEKLGYLDIAYIAKRSLFKIPLGHKFMWGDCYMPIDRDDKLQSLEVIKRSIELAKNKVTSIGVFPEGKRQSEAPLGEFHEGVFNIAIKAEIPIVICCEKNTDSIHKNFPKRFTHVTMEILGVIYPDEFINLPAKTVSDNVHKIMFDYLSK